MDNNNNNAFPCITFRPRLHYYGTVTAPEDLPYRNNVHGAGTKRQGVVHLFTVA